MSRLTHSNSGFIRSLQISKHNLFVFVEGQTHDPYFYDKLCKHICKSKDIKYTVKDAKQLPGETGGKNKLITFFEYLRENSLLVLDFDGEKKTFAFFLDKDIDDFLGRQISSPHLVYTKYYTIENHLYIDGNLTEAIAAAASLSEDTANEIIRDNKEWRKTVASTWKDWIKISLFARVYNINCECNFKTPSKINKPFCQNSIDQKAHKKYLDFLQNRSGFSEEDFTQKFSEISTMVDNLFAQGNHDFLFQGKWYGYFVVEAIKSVKSNVNGLDGKIESTLLMTMNFKKSWVKHFAVPLNNVVAMLN